MPSPTPQLSDAAVKAVKRARKVVTDIVDGGRGEYYIHTHTHTCARGYTCISNTTVAYGVTTGFGKFANVHIPTELVE